MENFQNMVIKCLTEDYANFSGRASRSEYWFFALFCVIVGFIIGFLGAIVGNEKLANLISLVFNVAILVPSIAVTVRRMHDLDKSGWWLLIALIPFIGTIYLIIQYCIRGTQGANRFGKDPLANM